MLEFSDLPYQFFAPRPSRAVIALAQWWNHAFTLPGRDHRIAEVVVRGADPVRDLAQRGARLLLLPNHPTHSDPQIVTEACRRVGLPSYFMAAYDVFLRRPRDAWIMQRTGSFSVDREGSDRKAMTTAITVLRGARSLIVFPEGNVYFTNDRVTPFLDGAAFIGARAQKEVGTSEPVFAVPVAIKATHLVDQRGAVLDRLDEVARHVGDRFDRTSTPLAELHRIGARVLAQYLADHQIDLRAQPSPPRDHATPLDQSLAAAASHLIEQLEQQLGIPPQPGEPPDARLRKVRSQIHRARIAPGTAGLDAPTANALAERAILALRIRGYTGGYVSDNPTLDRWAETAEKLLEDIRSAAPPPYGKRRALVEFGTPLDLREFRGRGAVDAITHTVEQRVQESLDRLNATNTAPGGRPFQRDAQPPIGG